MADDRLVAEIALKLGYLQRDQAARCMQAKRAGGSAAHLANVAFDLGLLTQEQVAQIQHHERQILARRQVGPQGVSGAEPAAISSGSNTSSATRTELAEPAPNRSQRTSSIAPGDTLVSAQEKLIPSYEVPSRPELPELPELDGSGLEGSTVQSETARARPSDAPPTRPSLVPPPPATASHSHRGPPRAVVAQKVLTDRSLEERTSGEVPFLLRALKFAVDNQASDLHVHAGLGLLARVHGRLVPFRGMPVLDANATEKVVAQLLNDDQWEILERDGEVDLALQVRGLGRFRCNAYRQHRGVDLVMRIIPLKPPTLESLGLPDGLSRLVDFRTGLVLCTGPTGSGKSTTLAALLNTVIHSRKEHVLTIENPVEFVFDDAMAKVTQRQVGAHTQSFARALRAALREDPDVIAITELRDRETISLALTAAETGHLVLGTLHTSNAAQTIGRVVNAFPADEQAQVRAMLSESLRAVISQRLVTRADGPGRVAAIEILIVNVAVTNLIREGREFQLGSLMQTGKSEGMRTLDDSLFELLGQGKIDKQQAGRFAENKQRFR